MAFQYPEARRDESQVSVTAALLLFDFKRETRKRKTDGGRVRNTDRYMHTFPSSYLTNYKQAFILQIQVKVTMLCTD